MNAIFSKLRIVRHFTAILRDYNNTENVFAFVDELAHQDELMARFPPTPAMQAYMDAPFEQGFPKLETLRKLPEDTLGAALARHMDVLGVDFSQFDRVPADEGDDGLIQRHLFETHDIWHALTGFGIGPANEIGLQAFTLAQLEGVPPLALINLSLLRIFKMGGHEVAPLMDAITTGWTRGRQAKAMFGVDWREHFERPLADVQAEFGIVPVRREDLVEIAEKLAA